MRPSPLLAIVHVTIVGITGGAAQRDMTVLIDGNRIQVVAPADSVRLPAGARVIDGSGKFLIPGLWDMHVHAAWPYMAEPVGELFVANGVTGVRDMWGDPGVIADWRRRVSRGDAKTPRLVAAGNLVDGPEAVWPNSTRVATAEDARRAVQRLHRDGAEFIKVYSHLSRDAYFAIAEEAKRESIPFAGHVPIVVTAAEAADAGQRSVEHLTGIAIGCAGHEADWMRAINTTIRERGWAAASGMVRGRAAELAADYDAARCAELARHLASAGTWQTPTLTVLHNIAFIGDAATEHDPRLRWMPSFLIARWENRGEQIGRSSTAPEARAALFRREMQIVGVLEAAGVPILAGTDEANPYCMPGFSLHDELARLVDAGLSPLEALQAATLNPANFLGMTDSLGSVAPGKLADLVLLTDDPIADIHNTTHIDVVVLNGQVLDRSAREHMLSHASRASGPPLLNRHR